jgi:hypothetical protein
MHCPHFTDFFPNFIQNLILSICPKFQAAEKAEFSALLAGTAEISIR